MAMTSKVKIPERVTNPEVKKYYVENGTRFIGEGKQEIGFRYDQIEGRKLRLPGGLDFKNNVTLSQPSSEVLTILREKGEYYMLLGKQARSPYVVDVDGTLYSKVFLEQAAGLVEERQTFETAAMAEGRQELGVQLVYMTELAAPVICRHVSYSDERSKLYFAIAETMGDQELDETENISIVKIPMPEARNAYERYLSGDKSDFLGFDVPEMTLLSMSILFMKIDSGRLNFNELDESKNLLPI